MAKEFEKKIRMTENESVQTIILELTEDELIRILIDFVLKNSEGMHSPNLYEKCILKMEEISEEVLKRIHEKLKKNEGT